MLVESARRKPVAHDESPAIISDHAYTPRAEWWSLCKVCGLAQAAHAEVSPEATEAERQAHIAYYGDGSTPQAHHIVYYGDENPEAFE